MSTPHVAFIGRTTIDVVYQLDRLPPEDTKAFAQAFHAAAGGPACNAAITHALLGGQATLISAVGEGPFSAVVRGRLAELGIRLIDVGEASGYRTPLTTVLVATETGTRTIVNPPAQRDDFTFPTAWDANWGPIPAAALTDGFHLQKTLPLLRGLRGAGASICLDGGSWKQGTEELVPLLTAAICSERFAVPGANGSPDSTLDWFAEQGVDLAAVTRGSKPIVAEEKGRRFEIPVRPVRAVDTLGAGDVLHGAFCFHIAQGEPFETALRRASEIASRSCEEFGIDHLVEPQE
jgi:sugar/nucleoside kinase (ribokinase family)